MTRGSDRRSGSTRRSTAAVTFGPSSPASRSRPRCSSACSRPPTPPRASGSPNPGTSWWSPTPASAGPSSTTSRTSGRPSPSSLEGEEADASPASRSTGCSRRRLSIVVTYDPARGAPNVLGRHAIADAGLYSACLAIENLWLAATAEGMGMGWVSFYRERFVRELLGIPEAIRPVAWLCVGPVTHLEDDARPRAPRLARAPRPGRGPALRPTGAPRHRGRPDRRPTTGPSAGTEGAAADGRAGTDDGAARRPEPAAGADRQHPLHPGHRHRRHRAQGLGARRRPGPWWPTGSGCPPPTRMPPTGDGGMVPTLGQLVAAAPGGRPGVGRVPRDGAAAATS